MISKIKRMFKKEQSKELAITEKTHYNKSMVTFREWSDLCIDTCLEVFNQDISDTNINLIELYNDGYSVNEILFQVGYEMWSDVIAEDFREILGIDVYKLIESFDAEIISALELNNLFTKNASAEQVSAMVIKVLQINHLKQYRTLASLP